MTRRASARWLWSSSRLQSEFLRTGAALATAYLLFSLVTGTALLVYAMLGVREGISAPPAGRSW